MHVNDKEHKSGKGGLFVLPSSIYYQNEGAIHRGSYYYKHTTDEWCMYASGAEPFNRKIIKSCPLTISITTIPISF